MKKVLNLYAGVGGNRLLWEGVEVTAVEYSHDIAEVYKDLYPQDLFLCLYLRQCNDFPLRRRLHVLD